MIYLDRESKNKQKSLKYFVCYPQGICIKIKKRQRWAFNCRVPAKNRVPNIRSFFAREIPFQTYFAKLFLSFQNVASPKKQLFFMLVPKKWKRTYKNVVHYDHSIFGSPGVIFTATFLGSNNSSYSHNHNYIPSI